MADKPLYIPFTQYLPPRGVKSRVRFPTTNVNLHAKAMAIIENGFVFEAEKLRDSDIVSLTVTHPEYGDFVCVLVHNGPDVLVKVHDMINDFDIEKMTKRVQQMSQEDDNNE